MFTRKINLVNICTILIILIFSVSCQKIKNLQIDFLVLNTSKLDSKPTEIRINIDHKETRIKIFVNEDDGDLNGKKGLIFEIINPPSGYSIMTQINTVDISQVGSSNNMNDYFKKVLKSGEKLGYKSITPGKLYIDKWIIDDNTPVEINPVVTFYIKD